MSLLYHTDEYNSMILFILRKPSLVRLNLIVAKRYYVVNRKLGLLVSSLASLGHGKILQFDNKTESLCDGLAFILCDNVWGTNFPLRYGDNAYFAFEIK